MNHLDVVTGLRVSEAHAVCFNNDEIVFEVEKIRFESKNFNF